MLINFMHSSGALAFDCIDSAKRQQFAADLRIRAADPSRIDQGQTPLCGPAAFIHCIATDRPADYVRYVLDLATTGTGTLGGLTVTPSNDCLKASLLIRNTSSNALDAVDWVALASLRDASNAFLDMNGPGSNAAGITVGSALANWFSKTGWYPGGVSDSTGYAPQSFEHLLGINQRINSHVCLFLRSAIVASSSAEVGINKFSGSGTPKTWLGTPDHWVVLKNRLTIDLKAPPLPGMPRPAGLENKRLDFSFWHWGQRQPTPANSRIHNLTPAQFLPYYYGYVSATR